MYGRRTECAIAVMSRLAEVYDGGETRLSAVDIAKTRGLSLPFVSKILSILSQAGLVIGSRGPGGGSSLARDPQSIRIFDVFKLFERQEEEEVICPFQGIECDESNPCPMHEKLASVKEAMGRLLHETTFAEFHRADQEREEKDLPTPPPDSPTPPLPTPDAD